MTIKEQENFPEVTFYQITESGPTTLKAHTILKDKKAYYMAMKKAPQRTQEMKLIYEDELQRALQEDGSAASVYISPKTYYPEI